MSKTTINFWKRFNSDLFQKPNFSKIDSNKEGLLDFCPICNEQLPDKKVLTFKTHEWNKHRKTDEEQVKIINRNMLLLPIITITAMSPLLVIFIGMAIIDYSDDLDGWTVYDDCYITKNTMLSDMYNNDGFTENDISTLNGLVEDCGMRFNIYPSDESIMDELGFVDPEINYFNDEKRYEKTQKALDELYKERDTLR